MPARNAMSARNVMTVKCIDHVNLTVADFDATAAWYGRVFGFEVVEEGDQDGNRWGVLRTGDSMLCIYEYPDCRLDDRHALRKAGLHGINHFGFRITDGPAWEMIVEREELDVLYGGPLHWPHSMSWYITDPTGWEIEVALWDADTVAFD